MAKIILVRHGYSVYNKEDRFAGQLDIPLDEIGVTQAESVCRYIIDNYRVDKVYSSCLSRAYNTVKKIGDHFNIEIIKSKEISELDVGVWGGMKFSDVEKIYPEAFKKYKESPAGNGCVGGECFNDLIKRSTSYMEKIANENKGKTIVVGTHGGVIKSLLCKWGGHNPENLKELPIVPNASITIVNYENGKAEFEVIGYDDYLEITTTYKLP